MPICRTRTPPASILSAPDPPRSIEAAPGLLSPECRQANATLTHGAGPATDRDPPGEPMSVANPTRDDFAEPARRILFRRPFRRRPGRQGHHHGHRKRHGHHRRRPEGRRPRAAEGIRRQGQGRPAQGRRHRRSLCRAHRERAWRSDAVARQGPPRRELGPPRREVQPRASASKASSSTRSRAASPSISTAPWPSCRAARSTSVRSATSPR